LVVPGVVAEDEWKQPEEVKIALATGSEELHGLDGSRPAPEELGKMGGVKRHETEPGVPDCHFHGGSSYLEEQIGKHHEPQVQGVRL
jgi:hypothetical protein